MNWFLIDERRNVFKSYDDLLNDLNRLDTSMNLVQHHEPYPFFLHLIHSMISEREVVLLDSDLSDNERDHLNVMKEEYVAADPLSIPDVDSLIHTVNNVTGWKAGIYTSGTSGRPKLVSHTMNTLTKFSAPKRSSSASKTWAFCYNHSHIAGVQVFLQALLNRDTIVYLYDTNKTQLNDALIRFEITHISATPTFYRVALAHLQREVPSVKRLLFGGERFEENLANRLKPIFVNAITRNIYASTEVGSLLASSGKVFSIPERLHHKIKISDEDGELLILREELADFSGREGDSDDREWYPTGDLARYVSETEFEIVGRKTEMINVGGYKVNPHEIEEQLRKIAGVKDAFVGSKPNALIGQMLTAQIVKESAANETEIENYIAHHLPLQAWKIPRIVYFVDEVKISRTGKLVR